MRVIIENDADQVAKVAAFFVGQVIHENRPSKTKNPVLGLATGSTPLKLYEILIEQYKAGELSFAGVTTFNLDEYVGLPANHEQSYRNFMQRHLFDHIDIDPASTFLPSVSSPDLRQEGLRYDQRILEAGGIDLQLLGIGFDGHIGFNEPGSSLASPTRLKALTRQTRADNSRFFDSIDQVPKLSVTMGIGSILKAKQCLLLATGTQKQDAVQAMIEGPVSSRVPASALQLHPNTVVLLDEAAAAKLEFQDYYRDSESLQREIQPIAI